MADTAAILAHENVRKRMLAGAEMLGRKIEPAEPRALPILTYQRDVTIWLNGEPVRALHVPPGHTDGDTIVFFTRSNVVHMGDDFFATGFPFVDLDSGGTVHGLIGALDEVLPQIPPDAKVIPGHGELQTVATPGDLHCGWMNRYWSPEKNLEGIKMGINILMYYLTH